MELPRSFPGARGHASKLNTARRDAAPMLRPALRSRPGKALESNTTLSTQRSRHMWFHRRAAKKAAHLLFQGQPAHWAGSLLFVGGAVVWLVDTIAESLYPNYSVMRDALSTLGDVNAPTRWLWNSATILLGVAWLVGALLLFVRQKPWLWLALNLLPPSGVLLVGLFPAGSVNTIHLVASYVIFTASGVVMVVDALGMGRPFRFFSIILGALSLGGLALSMVVLTATNPPLGAGGEERIILYPLLIWLMSFGGVLMAQPAPLPGAEALGTLKSDAPSPHPPSPWRRRWIPGIALCVVLGLWGLTLAVALSSGALSAGTVTQPRLTTRWECPSGSHPLVCAFTITNPPEASASVRFKLFSASPVQFSSAGGSLAPDHSMVILITVPNGVCTFAVTLQADNGNPPQTIPIDACPQAQGRVLQTRLGSSAELPMEPDGNAQDPWEMLQTL